MAAPATIVPVGAAVRSSSVWDDVSGRGLQIGEDFLRKLLGLGGGAAAPPGSADLDLILAQQKAQQTRTLLLVGGGLAAVVLLVVLLRK